MGSFGASRGMSHGSSLVLRRLHRLLAQPKSYGWSKNEYQTGTLVGGNMEKKHLRNPSCLVSSHTDIGLSPNAGPSPHAIHARRPPIDYEAANEMKHGVFLGCEVRGPRSTGKRRGGTIDARITQPKRQTL